MAYKPHERPVKPHTLDKRSEKAAQPARPPRFQAKPASKKRGK